MKGLISTIAAALLAGSGGQSEPASAVDVVAVVNGEPNLTPTPVASACEAPAYDAVGNRWWGGFTACHGRVRVDIEADSVNLGGPSVRVTVRTSSCPAGRGAAGGSVDRAFFERPFEAQLGEVKRTVRRYLAQIDQTCGGSAHAQDLLGRQFDAAFRDLAGRYWLVQSRFRGPA